MVENLHLGKTKIANPGHLHIVLIGYFVCKQSIHTKNVLLHPVNSLVKVADFGMACLISKPRIYKIGATPQKDIFKIGKRLCINDETKQEKLENIFVNSVNS